MSAREIGSMSTKPRIGRKGVLAFIVSEISAGRKIPTKKQIAERFGWQITSAGDALNGLVADGHLTVTSRERSGRGWKYTYEMARE